MVSVLALALLMLMAPFAYSQTFTESGELLEQRARYQSALQAAKAEDWARVERERQSIQDYPLVAYLDYETLRRQLSTTSGEVARDFAEDQRFSPLGLRYLGRYLRRAGQERRWGDFLAATPREPNSERLRCYYGRALRSRGRNPEAWAVAEKLWVSTSSVDKACDPLFALWRAQGGLSDALIWERAKLAFSGRQGSLLRYLGSLATAQLAPDLAALQRVYQEPQRTVALSTPSSERRRGEMIALGLVRFSRYSPARAWRQWSSLTADTLDAAQHAEVAAAIAYRGLLERESALKSWLDQNLAKWRDDKLTGIRLRWAISDSDWPAINTLVLALTETAREEGTWRYWQARALEALGQGEAATALLKDLAGERSYYGFLSADRLGLPYRYNYQTVPVMLAVFDAAASVTVSGGDSSSATTPPALSDWARAALWRVHELYALDDQRGAHTEWAHALQRLTGPEQLQFAVIAKQQNWYRLGIDAANASRSWDAIDLRFPLAYLEAFEKRATRQALPVHQLMAIARRESAFAPSARSPVGARGLMQIMPETGRAVARKAGTPLKIRELYSVDTNLDLGSAYYRQLLDRFNGNRAVALAAYNAGPNRVQNWVGQQRSFDSWVETIPYRETRDYVKAVLAYSVVFAYRMGNSVPLLSEPERSALY
ncbi:MAG: transglycosylase SLT domain-containing protein [Congregibacter sp.]